MKKVLIITYYWPPGGGSGVQRWMYFAKYLSGFGIIPVVLTVSEKYASYPQTDHKLNKEVRHIKVFKTKTFEPLRFYSFLISGNKTKGIPQGEVSNKKNPLVSVAKFIRGSLFIPDARKFWNIFAFKQAKLILKNEKPDIIITTGPPHSVHLTGLKLKKKFSVKWIADFRDPWTDLYYNKDFIRTRRAIKKDSKLEKKVLANADIILTVGSKMKELLAKKIKGSENKIKYVYNGYDAELFTGIIVEKSNKFEISYIGLLTENSPYKSFALSVKDFVQKISSEKDIVLNFAGKIRGEIINCFKSELPRVKIRYYGYVSHEKAISIMKKSDLLVSCLPETEQSEIIISGKTAEYAATGNPILSFGNKSGESALILNNLEFAATFSKNEIKNASAFIKEIYEKKKNGKPAKNNIKSELIKNMSRCETTRLLAELINEIS